MLLFERDTDIKILANTYKLKIIILMLITIIYDFV